jgi:hypothetical protein
MSNDPKTEALIDLRAHEAATVKSMAFWEKQPPIEILGDEWGHLHFEGLKRQLGNIQEAIRILEAPNA